jgi:hypothetical protein
VAKAEMSPERAKRVELPQPLPASFPPVSFRASFGLNPARSCGQGNPRNVVCTVRLLGHWQGRTKVQCLQHKLCYV